MSFDCVGFHENHQDCGFNSKMFQLGLPQLGDANLSPAWLKQLAVYCRLTRSPGQAGSRLQVTLQKLSVTSPAPVGSIPSHACLMVAK